MDARADCFANDPSSRCDCTLRCKYAPAPLNLDKAEQAIEPWKPCPETIRMCIEALPGPAGFTYCGFDGWIRREHAAEAIEAILFKPDPAILASKISELWHDVTGGLYLGNREEVTKLAQAMIDAGIVAEGRVK